MMTVVFYIELFIINIMMTIVFHIDLFILVNRFLKIDKYIKLSH